MSVQGTLSQYLPDSSKMSQNEHHYRYVRHLNSLDISENHSPRAKEGPNILLMNMLLWERSWASFSRSCKSLFYAMLCNNMNKILLCSLLNAVSIHLMFPVLYALCLHCLRVYFYQHVSGKYDTIKRVQSCLSLLVYFIRSIVEQSLEDNKAFAQFH